jgi:hypothetical protein
MTTGQEGQLITDLTPLQVASMETPIPEFTALVNLPSYLGYAAHSRLEEALGMPVASDDANPVADERTGQRGGMRLGDLAGRQQEFGQNLPQIKSNVKQVADERGIPENEMWDSIMTIMLGSGITKPMHRTLDRPVEGSYGARTYIEEHADSGIALIVRENIANWGARRQDRLAALIGGMSERALSNLSIVIYAGSGRPYSTAELWRPELQPFVAEQDDGQKTSSLTESSVAQKIHTPQIKELLTKRNLDNVTIDTVIVDNPKANGDEVVEAIAQKHGDRLRDLLIVEAGNAPAGYTQLAAAMILAKTLGIDPTTQYLAVTDGVELVRHDHYDALNLEGRSKVQNLATAINSFNGWLQAIARVNQYMLDRSQKV